MKDDRYPSAPYPTPPEGTFRSCSLRLFDTFPVEPSGSTQRNRKDTREPPDCPGNIEVGKKIFAPVPFQVDKQPVATCPLCKKVCVNAVKEGR